MKTYLGLDIGSHSVKIVELGVDGQNSKLLAIGTSPTPPQTVGSSSEADIAALGKVVQGLLRQTGVRSRAASIALPESQVFTRVISVPSLTQQELSSAIKWEAEQYIPLPLEQVVMDYSVLRDSSVTGNGMMQVLLVAAPKTLLERYVAIVEQAGLGIYGVETEIISATRALTASIASVRTAMIVSLGAQTTDLAILQGGIISFTRSINAGGEALSRALVQGFGFQLSQAEAYKNTYGLDRKHLEGKIVEAVKPIMDTIVMEIKRAMAFFVEQYPQDRVEVVVLSGGTARIPGMVMYMAEHVGVEAQLANPFIGLQKEQRFSTYDAHAAVYSVATGLAQKR